MIRMILNFRNQNGAYGTVIKLVPEGKVTGTSHLTLILSELPAAATLVSLKFEASALMPEDIVLIAANRPACHASPSPWS